MKKIATIFLALLTVACGFKSAGNCRESLFSYQPVNGAVVPTSSCQTNECPRRMAGYVEPAPVLPCQATSSCGGAPTIMPVVYNNQPTYVPLSQQPTRHEYHQPVRHPSVEPVAFVSPRTVKITEKSPYHVAYEFKDVRLDDVAKVASGYCRSHGKIAYFKESLSYTNGTRLAVFDCDAR